MTGTLDFHQDYLCVSLSVSPADIAYLMSQPLYNDIYLQWWWCWQTHHQTVSVTNFWWPVVYSSLLQIALWNSAKLSSSPKLFFNCCHMIPSILSSLLNWSDIKSSSHWQTVSRYSIAFLFHRCYLTFWCWRLH